MIRHGPEERSHSSAILEKSKVLRGIPRIEAGCHLGICIISNGSLEAMSIELRCSEVGSIRHGYESAPHTIAKLIKSSR